LWPRTTQRGNTWKASLLPFSIKKPFGESTKARAAGSGTGFLMMTAWARAEELEPLPDPLPLNISYDFSQSEGETIITMHAEGGFFAIPETPAETLSGAQKFDKLIDTITLESLKELPEVIGDKSRGAEFDKIFNRRMKEAAKKLANNKFYPHGQDGW
jgi:hypothetical protein